MNDEDLRDFFAGLALIGLVMREGYNLAIEYDAYAIADNMIKRKHDPDPYGKNDEDYVEDEPEPEPEVGIAAVKRKRKTKETI